MRRSVGLGARVLWAAWAMVGCADPPSGTAPAPSRAASAAQRTSPDAAPAPDETSASSTSPTAATASPGPLASGIGTATSTAAPTAAPSAGPKVHCKAAGGSKPVRLGTHISRAVHLAVDPTGLYGLAAGRDWGSNERMVLRVGQDGSGVRTLATFSSTQAFGKLVLTAAGIVFSRRHGPKGSARDTLLRVSREGGSVEVLAEKFGWFGAEFGGNLYGIDYDYWAGSESVVRIPADGGEVKTLYRRKLGEYARGSGIYRFNDIAVDGTGVYLADEGDAALVKLPLEGGEPQRLLANTYQPSDLYAVGDVLYFCNRIVCYLEQVAKTGGKVTSLGEVWAIAPERERLWVFGRDEQALPRLAVVDGRGNVTSKGPPEHIFMERAAVDDECLYYVRPDTLSVSYFDAIAKPAP